MLKNKFELTLLPSPIARTSKSLLGRWTRKETETKDRGFEGKLGQTFVKQ
jgi:hypothetical protein